MANYTGTKLNLKPLGARFILGEDSMFAGTARFFEGITVPQQWIKDKVEQTGEFIEDKRIELQKKLNVKMMDLKEDSLEYLGKLRNRGGVMAGKAMDKTKQFVWNNKLFSLASFGLLFGPTIGALAFPI